MERQDCKCSLSRTDTQDDRVKTGYMKQSHKAKTRKQLKDARDAFCLLVLTGLHVPMRVESSVGGNGASTA